MSLLGVKMRVSLVVILVMLHIWPQPVSDGDALAAAEENAMEIQAERTAALQPMAPSAAEAPREPEQLPKAIEAMKAMEAERVTASTASVPVFPADPREVYTRLAAGDRTGGLMQSTVYKTPEQPTVYLTFDDGPTKLTSQVLDILQAYQVEATFFVLGELAEKQEELIRRIHREGHALGNHTYNHKYEELYRDFGSFWEQVVRTDEILTNLTGEKTTLFRAPGGTATNFDAFYFFYLQAAGYQVHDWTVDSGDSKRRGVSASEIVSNVKKAKLTHEVTLLLHDGAGHAETVKALPEIIEYYQGHGYRFAKLDPQVKPVMFQVRDIKWDRSTDERQYERMLATVLGIDQAEWSMASAALDADEWVPLRDWASAYGSVVWDASKAAAVVEVEDIRYEFHVRTGEVQRIDADGQRGQVDLFFQLEGGRVMLPLSETPKLEIERVPLLADSADLHAGA